jgi:hypothetical protein
VPDEAWRAVFADIYNVTAGVALIIVGISSWCDGGSGSKLWGVPMLLLGVVVLSLNMLGTI